MMTKSSKSSSLSRRGKTAAYVIKKERLPHEDSDSYVSEAEEDEIDYCTGGYHPVRIRDEFKNGQYVIIRKLGWGHFSTVWLAFDRRRNREVALKIVKSAKHYTETAIDEIQLLERIKMGDEAEIGKSRIVELLDSFTHHGPHGKHVCMVFEVLGENMLTIIRRFNHRGLPIVIVRRVARQILEGLDYMHRVSGIIHTDLKPENVLFQFESGFDASSATSSATPTSILGDNPASVLLRSLSSISISAAEQKQLQSSPTAGRGLKRVNSGTNSDAFSLAPESKRSQSPSKMQSMQPVPERFKRYESCHVKLVDLGNACWVDRHFTDDIQTRQYRSPEVIIKARYDASADIWSCACVLFEFLTGDFLFEPHSGEHFGKDDDHLAQMCELVGDFGLSFALSGQQSHKHFDRNGRLRNIGKLNRWALVDVLRDKYGYHRDIAIEFSEFLLPMLQLDPRDRATAQQMLKHPWLADSKVPTMQK